VSRLLLCPIFLTRHQRGLDLKPLTRHIIFVLYPRLTYQQPMALTQTNSEGGRGERHTSSDCTTLLINHLNSCTSTGADVNPTPLLSRVDMTLPSNFCGKVTNNRVERQKTPSKSYTSPSTLSAGGYLPFKSMKTSDHNDMVPLCHFH
jgi:hypothetical protein